MLQNVAGALMVNRCALSKQTNLVLKNGWWNLFAAIVNCRERIHVVHCRKNGLSCVRACGDCRGEGCVNAHSELAINNSDNDDDTIEGDDFTRNIFDIFE